MKKFESCLIVDDEIELLDAMRAGVDFLFERIDLCTNGQQAVELCKTNRYDLIISDIQMPLLKGDEFLRQLRSHGIITPFIFVSGNASETQIRQAEILGAAAFLEKPFDFEIYIQKVQDIIENPSRFEAVTN